jgi:hypothetical protein
MEEMKNKRRTVFEIAKERRSLGHQSLEGREGLLLNWRN